MPFHLLDGERRNVRPAVLAGQNVRRRRGHIAAGVATDLHVLAGAPHAFDSMLADTAVAQRVGRVLEDWLESRLHPGASESDGAGGT
jgi:acetyl esterase/lipase